MAAVARPFPKKEQPTPDDRGVTFSSFESWGSKTPRENLESLVGTLTEAARLRDGAEPTDRDAFLMPQLFLALVRMPVVKAELSPTDREGGACNKRFECRQRRERTANLPPLVPMRTFSKIRRSS